MLVISQYELSIILSDKLSTLVFVLFVALFTIFGEKYISELFRSFQYSEKNIREAFVSFPPEKMTDFAIFYFLLFVLGLLPILVELIWTSS